MIKGVIRSALLLVGSGIGVVHGRGAAQLKWKTYNLRGSPYLLFIRNPLDGLRRSKSTTCHRVLPRKTLFRSSCNLRKFTSARAVFGHQPRSSATTEASLCPLCNLASCMSLIWDDLIQLIAKSVEYFGGRTFW